MIRDNDIVIVAAKRTPIGNLLGSLSPLSAGKLGAQAHLGCLKDLPLKTETIDEIIMGCVLTAGLGQAPARQSALFADLPDSIPATTLNKMCGSGMKAVMQGSNAIQAGAANIVLAGGMESMSNAPYLLKKAREGYRLGHAPLIDSLFLDGLEDVYTESDDKLMGCFADASAKHFNISREAQDDFAKQSLTRALSAQKKGWFNAEIVPVTVARPKQSAQIITQDEHPDEAKLAKISNLKPCFNPTGTVTPANSSAISDGAASLLLMTAQTAKQNHLPILACIKGQSTHAQASAWFTTAPVPAIQKLLTQLNWRVQDVDLFEINEAFAVVTLIAIHELKLSMDQVNIYGGACALGHPIGASGARIIVTLLNALTQTQQKRGIAALCIGGGEATAMAIERI